jgi:4-azaleucine resistance transporter AzlC
VRRLFTAGTSLALGDQVMRAALAIGVAVGLTGVSFGAVAKAAGLSAAQTVASSVFVFTGASQFAFVGVVSGGGKVLAAVVPALVLAARNLLYGLALVPVLGGRLGRRLALSQLVIDETTAMARAQRDPATARRAFVATGVAVFVCWNVGTGLGVWLGSVIGDPRTLGLDAVFPAAFVALLYPRLAESEERRAALAGGLIAAVCIPLLPAGLPVLASVLGVLAGTVLRRRERGQVQE